MKNFLTTPLVFWNPTPYILHPSTFSVPLTIYFLQSWEHHNWVYSVFRISSDGYLTVTAVNEDYLSRDSYTVQPLSRLAHIYHIVSYYPSSLGTQFAIIATQDNSEVQIEFPAGRGISVVFRGVVYNHTMTIKLRECETLQIQVGL